MVPYAGVSFMLYETIKRETYQSFPAFSPSTVHLISGALAGAISQTAAYPLEVVRRRMQVGGQYQVDSFEAQVYRNTRATIRHIYQRHGFRGFFVGLSIGYIKVTPMSMISFWTYEACKTAFGIGSPIV
jgi:solute carrier family 25 protein 16